MNTETLTQLFARDFETLESEIFAYSTEENLWIKEPGINNSAGNLGLHLAGNLAHFLGAILNNSGYIRDREFEFNGKVDRDELINRIRDSRKTVRETLDNLTPEDFSKTYPLQPFGFEMSTDYFLIHLYSHFSYHLGQINYHRRLLDK
ncbi:DinB superfamily protein [Balneola sp. EhC07]|uniref:DinB family protein n=1 Tax=Balneola sp. EhC07 TaxID=1849360 RepID=UPI0007F52200|nr:DinB family protein [Balneola sp. EhC07]OAN60310.1 DinB superfamily protein [Balneola sp. EhC07]